MNRINSLEELRKLKEQVKRNTLLRTTGEDPERTIISVGMATCGIAAGSKDTMLALLDELENKDIHNVSVIGTDCLGFCDKEPIVEVKVHGKEAVKYGNVDANLAKEIINKHIIDGKILENLIIGREVAVHE